MDKSLHQALADTSPRFLWPHMVSLVRNTLGIMTNHHPGVTGVCRS